MSSLTDTTSRLMCQLANAEGRLTMQEEMITDLRSLVDEQQKRLLFLEGFVGTDTASFALFQRKIFNRSSIVTVHDLKHFGQWFTQLPTSSTLLYSASRDGFSPIHFHRLCDNKGPTLTIIRGNEDGDYVFGGFSNVSWACNFKATRDAGDADAGNGNGNGDDDEDDGTDDTTFVPDPSAWLFSLRNDLHLPVRFVPSEKQQHRALAHHTRRYRSYGACFGERDLVVRYDGRLPEIDSSIGTTYQLGHYENSPRKKSSVIGSNASQGGATGAVAASAVHQAASSASSSASSSSSKQSVADDETARKFTSLLGSKKNKLLSVSEIEVYNLTF